MHELALCEGLLRALEAEAGRNHFRRVTTVWLEIGPLANVEPEALRFGFEAASQGTLAEGARLEVVPVAAKAWCLPCGGEIAIDGYGAACPVCGSYQWQVLAGDALRIQQIEVV
ncbi:MAG: hydrogenase maturation nickel metallochaperone HypA [Acidiferrobacter thiooxydans]